MSELAEIRDALIDDVERRIRTILLGDLDDDGPLRVASTAVDECLKHLSPTLFLRRAFGEAQDSGRRIERSELGAQC